MKAKVENFIGSRTLVCFGVLWSGLLMSCDTQRDVLYLPPGNVEKGLQAFKILACTSCHAVAEQTIERPLPDPSIYVILGGQSTRVKSYTELVTAIINPSHRLSRGDDPRTITSDRESRMPLYNEVMSVQQLIDIVEFLKPTYYVRTPETISYQFPEH
jgi:sulfur-oxidizing protein SoxX